jgi:hypothetical protein
MMPECTPQQDNLLFRGEDFKVRRMLNSVQEFRLHFDSSSAGEQITHRADLLDARQTGILTFYHRDRPLPGRPDCRGEGVRLIDLRATSLKLNPLGRPTGLVRNRSGNGKQRGNFRCLPTTGSARGSHALTSTQDCQRQRYLESVADQPCGRQLGHRRQSGTTRVRSSIPAGATGAGSPAFHEHEGTAF